MRQNYFEHLLGYLSLSGSFLALKTKNWSGLMKLCFLLFMLYIAIYEAFTSETASNIVSRTQSCFPGSPESETHLIVFGYFHTNFKNILK